MTAVEAFAPAKVNLTLHVTGQRADGYHLLDSLVAFADVGDRLWLTEGDAMRLSVSGPFADGVPLDHRNLVWRAAELAGWTGEIRIEKNLPHGAGIGGGSSDAAAVLNALGAADNGASLGADVPVCRVGRAVRMRGIGEVLDPAEGWPNLHAVLVNPGVHVPTPAVFKALQTKTNAPMSDVPETLADPFHWLAQQRNDLQSPATRLTPDIAPVLTALNDQPGVKFVRMSGSGATCFALFDEAAMRDAAADALTHAHPDWWVKACRLT